jgi:cyclopropane fatty-acyl-phospholipid synthase-like methyltransferase
MTLSLYNENASQTISETDTFTLERYKQFAEYLNDSMTVLDIGCNTGRGGNVIKKLYPKTMLYGIELISERIEKIPIGIYEHVYNISITNWESNHIRFDRIIAGELIEHIPENDFISMLMICKRYLKKDGLILFTTPNPNSLLVKLGRNSVFNDPSHVNIMSVRKFKDIINKVDLKIKKIEGSGKVTRLLGSKLPLINLYGSYLAILTK